VSGVDAGSQIIPLASRKYAVISALVYSLPEGKQFFLKPESMSQTYSHSENSFRGQVNIRREAKLYETAYKFLDSNQETELLLLDGPLIFSSWWKIICTEKDKQRFINAANRLLKKCRHNGIKIAGVVKRPSARYLVHYLGYEQKTDLPDSFLLHQTLKPGERTDIFSPGTSPRISNDFSIMDTIETVIYSFYCRLSKDWAIPPIRIDVPVFNLSCLDEIADYCYSTSIWNGIPLPIIKADEAAKVSKRFIGDVYSEILCKVGGKNTENLTHLAPYWGEGYWMGI
jgi:hypothetical protein